MKKYFVKTNIANKKKVIFKKLSTVMYLSLYILIFSSIYKSSLPTNESLHAKKLTYLNNQKQMQIGIYEVSRPRELPPQSLAKRCMNLSTHTASIKQPSLLVPISSGRTNLDLSLLSF